MIFGWIFVGFFDAKPTDAPIMGTFGLLPKRHAKPIAAPPLPDRAVTPCCCGSKQLTCFLPLRACSIRMVYHWWVTHDGHPINFWKKNYLNIHVLRVGPLWYHKSRTIWLYLYTWGCPQWSTISSNIHLKRCCCMIHIPCKFRLPESTTALDLSWSPLFPCVPRCFQCGHHRCRCGSMKCRSISVQNPP